MSETAKSRAAEGVPSARSRPVAEEPAAPPTALAERPGCLLLTPALRVAPEPETPSRAANGAGSTLRLEAALRADRTAWRPGRKEAQARAARTANRETWPLFLTDAPAAPTRSAAPAAEPQAEPCDAATLEQRIAELEAAVAGAEEDWEPDGSEASVAATGGRAPPAEAPPAALAVEAGDDDTVMVDEEMLRELVTDIVRAELQGPLGERITRNVRKLVRREINRALSLRDVE